MGMVTVVGMVKMTVMVMVAVMVIVFVMVMVMVAMMMASTQHIPHALSAMKRKYSLISALEASSHSMTSR